MYKVQSLQSRKEEDQGRHDGGTRVVCPDSGDQDCNRAEVDRPHVEVGKAGSPREPASVGMPG